MIISVPLKQRSEFIEGSPSISKLRGVVVVVLLLVVVELDVIVDDDVVVLDGV